MLSGAEPEWAVDFVHDVLRRTWDSRAEHVHAFMRECLALEVDAGFPAGV
jgi:hypothetical protein